MNATNAEVSSEALTGLQGDLRNLSSSLHDLYDVMNADMSQVSEFWQDPKYQEFVDGYKPQVNKCEEISQRYNKWCSSVLQEAIDKVVEIEMANVGGGAGSVSSVGGSAAAGVAGGAAAGKVSRLGKKSSSDSKKTPSKEATPKAAAKKQSKPSTKKEEFKVEKESAESIVINATDEICAHDHNAKGRIKVEKTYEDDSWNFGGEGKIEASKEYKLVDVKGELSGHGQYNSGKENTHVVIERDIDCSNFKK